MRASLDDKRFLRITFYSLWLITLIVQSYLVELRGDEAYYWRYAQQLAWGYFDHPPVTPFLISIGYFFFQNELGVRFLFIALITATIWVMEKLIQPDNLKLFYMIVASIAFLQIGMVFGGGMFAIPDFPLLFFTALFFYLYKKYLEESSGLIIILLSITISLLLLSKYHGILVIGFTVLSNLKLFTKRSFWIIIVLTTVLLIPHFHWQVVNDFPSTRFHLFERSSKPYSISYTLEYLAAQPFILGPFIGLLLLYIGITFRPQDAFERSLKFLIIGTYVFFFLMTFKGSVEGNWTIITLIPLVYVGYSHIQNNERFKKITFYSFAFSIPIILLVRFFLVESPFPAPYSFEKFFGSQKWASELKEKSKGLPVAFLNSYQRAALYEFYSGVPAFSLNNFWYRKNQYTIWDTEASVQGKSVVTVANYPMPKMDSLYLLDEYVMYSTIKNFRSPSNILVQSNLTEDVKCKAGDKLQIKIKFNYRNENIRDLEANPDYLSKVAYAFFKFSDPVEMGYGPSIKNDMINGEQYFDLQIIAPRTPDQYDFYLTVCTGWFPPGINSRKVRFIVE
jgi:hypothetical protein